MHPELRTKIENLSDAGLLEMSEADPADYLPEFLRLAQEEVTRRGGKVELEARARGAKPKVCPACRTEGSSQAHFCPQCGSPLVAEHEPSPVALVTAPKQQTPVVTDDSSAASEATAGQIIAAKTPATAAVMVADRHENVAQSASVDRQENRYFYAVGTQKNGPVSLDDLCALAADEKITRKTRVWQPGMKSWQAAGTLPEIFCDLPPDLESDTLLVLTPPPLTIPTNQSTRATPSNLWSQPPQAEAIAGSGNFMKQRRTLFIVLWPIAFLLLGLAEFLETSHDDSSGYPKLKVLSLLGVGALAIAVANWMKIHHRLWKLLPPSMASTTPGKAVGFYFIPFFNLYWMFVTFHGLARDANRTLSSLGEKRVRCNEGLALAFSIVIACQMSVGALTPLLSFPLAIANYVLWILLYGNLCRAFEVIAKHAPAEEALPLAA